MSPNTSVNYMIEPSQYQHWSVKYEGETATLQLNINEDGGIRPGYKLKLNTSAAPQVLRISGHKAPCQPVCSRNQFCRKPLY